MKNNAGAACAAGVRLQNDNSGDMEKKVIIFFNHLYIKGTSCNYTLCTHMIYHFDLIIVYYLIIIPVHLHIDMVWQSYINR